MLASFAVGALSQSRYTPRRFRPADLHASRLMDVLLLRCRFLERTMLAFCCIAMLSASSLAQSDSRYSSSGGSGSRAGQQILAEPKPAGANPFLPSFNRDLRFPVAVKGFCVVALRDQQTWTEGSEAYQHVFDGQLYWFTGQRERTIFASNPRRYVPALAGDCVVTFAQRGERVKGDPQYGILHDRRLYFFSGHAELEEFRAKPEKYAVADLALEGRCLVSQIDEQRQIPGVPETTVIVQGLRYQFAGIHQKRRFLNNMVRYGVERPRAIRVDQESAGRFARPSPLLVPENTKPHSGLTKQDKPKSSRTVSIKNQAMGGYSPVSIREKGIWVEGDPRFREEFDGLTYLLASEQEQLLFQQNPNAYVPALAGHCVVTDLDENRRVKGTIYHAAQHEGEGRLFLFAGAKEKQQFNNDPGRYLQADLAANGLCVVSLLQEREQIKGLPEFLTWHKSKRYLFASAEKQAMFLENVELYQEQ